MPISFLQVRYGPRAAGGRVAGSCQHDEWEPAKSTGGVRRWRPAAEKAMVQGLRVGVHMASRR
jgi:hypothetical protein